MLAARIRRTIQSVIITILFISQSIPVAGPWLGLMTLPMATYLFSLLWIHPEFLGLEVHLLLFSWRLMLGRTVALSGLVVFLVASVQYWRRRDGLVTTGLYSVVRHPQYLGLIVMTLGISVMCWQWRGAQDVFVLWVTTQVPGYVFLAFFEERCLAGEYGEGYQQYKQRVPFILPATLPSISHDAPQDKE